MFQCASFEIIITWKVHVDASVGRSMLVGGYKCIVPHIVPVVHLKNETTLQVTNGLRYDDGVHIHCLSDNLVIL